MSSSFIEFITTFIFHLFAKDLVDLHYLLGMEVVSTNDQLFLSHHMYTWNMLEHTKMSNAKVTSTPLSTAIPLQLHDGTFADPVV